MEKEEQQIKKSPRTRFTLENWIRMSFYPKGYREFMEGVNYELELGPQQSSMNEFIGTSADIFKYITYAAMIGTLAYKLAYEIFK